MGRREVEQSRRDIVKDRPKKRFPKVPKMIGEGLLVLGMVGTLGACGAKMATTGRVEQSSGATLIEREALLESQVVLAPSSDGRTLSAEVVVFEPSSSTGRESIREVMEGIVEACRDSGNMQSCINDRAIETTGRRQLENPTLEFEYYNRETGEWESLNEMGLVQGTDCDISNLAPGIIRVRFNEADGVRSSYTVHEMIQNISLRGTAAIAVLQSGVESGGQVQIDHERISVDGQRMLRISANVTGENMYLWLHYQSIGTEQLVLNPRYSETSQPRYVGVVMRNITLTDGTTGDFVVRVYGNGTRPSQSGEFSPMVESDGRVRPENVLYQLESGGLVPELNSRYSENLSEAAKTSSSPRDTVHEYGATRSVVLIRQE